MYIAETINGSTNTSRSARPLDYVAIHPEIVSQPQNEIRRLISPKTIYTPGLHYLEAAAEPVTINTAALVSQTFFMISAASFFSRPLAGR